MNTDQIASIVRTGLKIVGAFLMAHGYAKAGDMANQTLNSPEVIGFIVTGLGLLWSHFTHASLPGATGGASKTGGAAVLFIFLSAASLSLTACNTTPQQSTYRAVGTTVVSVDTAMKLWGDYVAVNHPSTAVEQQVKAAYTKYQRSMAAACDLGAMYAATSVTNAPAASQVNLALAQAMGTASQDLSDLENLIASFGVKL